MKGPTTIGRKGRGWIRPTSAINTTVAAWVLALATPLTADALGLGRGVSAPIIGRPFEMSVALNLDPGEDATKLCPQAEIFYGDSRIPDSAVRTQITRSAGGLYSLRVRVDRPVNEPVVTATVRAGCDQSTVSRRYVMLAEALTPEAEVVEAPTGVLATAGRRNPPVDLSETFSGNATAPLASTGPLNRSSTALARRELTAEEQAERQARRERRAARAAERRAAARSEVKAKSAGRADRSPRVRDTLQVAPWDLSEAVGGALRSETVLRSEPIGDEKQRAAFAALWQIMRASPEEVARSAQRLDQLETAVKRIEADSAKQRSQIGVLGQELQTARQQRNWLAIAAAAGFGLLAIAVGLILWRRSRFGSEAQAPWWDAARSSSATNESTQNNRSFLKRRRKKTLDDDEDEQKAIAKGAVSSQPTTGTSFATKASLDDLDSDFDSVIGPRSEPVVAGASQIVNRREGATSDVATAIANQRPLDLPRSHFSGPEPMAFTDSVPAGAITSTEELLDIQQQADFFACLGQHNRALELLRDHLEASTETSPLVQLDLIDLLHRLGRKDEFEAERQRFNASFRTQVPDFEHYPPRSEGLAAYEAAMSRIEALWPSPKVLTVIDESILRRSDTADDVFDLEAYRDLMLLYAVAKDLNDETHALGVDLDLMSSNKAGDPSTAMQPLPSTSTREKPTQSESTRAAASVTVATDVSQEEIERLMQPAHSRRLGVDIDLGSAFGDVDVPVGDAAVDMLAETEPTAELAPEAGASTNAAKQPAASVSKDAASPAPARPSFLKPLTSRPPRSADDNSVEFDWPDSKTKHELKRERFQNTKR